MLSDIHISSSKKKTIIYLLLTVVTLAVYWQVSRYAFINIDDNIYVSQNRYIQSGITPEGLIWAFSTTYAGFWHPLTWLSLMLDYQLYGLNPGGYHVTNLILHVLSTLLLFWLFCRMTKAVWKSALVAVLFALHPLHVESVAWIAERKDVLSAFFWMLTLCFYVRHTEKPGTQRYLAAVFSFACGLMSKSMIVTLPFIMILLDYWPLNRFASRKSNPVFWQAKEKAPFFILSAVFSIVTLYARDFSFTGNFSFASGIPGAFISYVFYLGKIFWPHDLSVLRIFSDTFPVWQTAGAFLLVAAISIFAIVMARRLPFFLVGWLWYLIALLPVTGIIPVGRDVMPDRFDYLPSIGIAAALAWGIPSFMKSYTIRKKFLFPAGVTVLVILAALTWKQCGYWRNSIELLNHSLRTSENNFMAHNNLGLALSAEGKITEAIEHYGEAIRIKPNYPYSYLNRGVAWVKLGRHQQAIDNFDEAIRLDSAFAEAYLNRGAAYGDLGWYQRAIENFTKAININPDYTEAYFNRGITYLRHGNKQPGCYDAQKVCEHGDCRLLESAKANGFCP